MKIVNSAVIFCSILLIFTGCSGKKGVNNYILNPQSSIHDTGQYSYVILGARNGSNHDLSCLFSLNLNGQNVGMQGIASAIAQKVPFSITANNHVSYVENDKNDTSYLVWKIPNSSLKKSKNEALLYVSAIGGSKNFLRDKVFFYFDGFLDMPMFSRPSAMNLYPILGSQNPLFNWKKSSALQKEPPVSSFKSIFFEVKPDAGYYLGDISINTDVSRESIDINKAILTLKIIDVKSVPNEKQAKDFLAKLNIPSKDNWFNLHSNWSMNSIEMYFNQTRSNLPK